MGRLSLTVAACAALAVVIPSHGKYLAIGLGLFAVVLGVMAWRQDATRAAARLAGAGGMAVGGAAVALGGLKVALTLAALQHLGHVFH